ncbi:MAG: phage portal protein [Tepidisphaeraceae bacterium]
MQMTGYNVWTYSTQPQYNALRPQGYAGFYTDAQKARLERIRQSRLLFRGGHRDYFLGEGRTQHDFPPAEVNGRTIQPYITANVLELISKKTADLLFGQEPILRVDDEVQQDKLAALADRASLHERIYDTAVECSYEAEAFVECCVKDGGNGEGVYVKRVPADEIFPDGVLGADGQYERYVRFAVRNVGTTERPIWLLLETWYLIGSIERKLWQLDDQTRRMKELDLKAWPRSPGEAPLQPSTPTRIKLNTVTWIPNELDHDEPVSDYDKLISLQDKLNAHETQIDRILEKHADPVIAAPEHVANNKGGMSRRQKVFFFREGQDKPGYIVRDLQLESAMKNSSNTLRLLLIIAEVSPSLLGLKEGAAPDAWKKLRLEASNSLFMAQRKAARWRPRLRRIATVAQALENTIPGERYNLTPISAELRDGIPADDAEQAEVISIKRAAGVMSVRRALETELVDESAIETEEDRLAAERAAKTPSILLGGGTGDGREAGELDIDAGEAA